jgi:hypothetical protein
VTRGLRLLWSRRILVALGAVLAVCAMALVFVGPVAPRGGSSVVGVASERWLIDTPDSQLVYANPKAANTLAMRATLLADLLASDKVKAQIVRGAGLKPDQVEILGPSQHIEPVTETPLVTQALVAAAAPKAPYRLSIYSDGSTPLIAADAQAADAKSARALVESARKALEGMLPQHSGGSRSGVVLEQLAAPEPKEMATHSRARLIMFAAALLVFPLWCAALIMGSGLAERLRASRQAEQTA